MWLPVLYTMLLCCVLDERCFTIGMYGILLVVFFQHITYVLFIWCMKLPSCPGSNY
uniref:Uncharacterized protein n=1 Tax=Arundo donax TaxID=35708 RepID=A0A0A9FKL6_ARUDO